jgi:hypothetical protein
VRNKEHVFAYRANPMQRFAFLIKWYMQIPQRFEELRTRRQLTCTVTQTKNRSIYLLSCHHTQRALNIWRPKNTFLYEMLPNYRKSIAFVRYPGLAGCPSKSNMSLHMSMEHWWNDADKGKPNYSGGGGVEFSQCYFVHHESHTHRAGIEPRLPQW